MRSLRVPSGDGGVRAEDRGRNRVLEKMLNESVVIIMFSSPDMVG